MLLTAFNASLSAPRRAAGLCGANSAPPAGPPGSPPATHRATDPRIGAGRSAAPGLAHAGVGWPTLGWCRGGHVSTASAAAGPHNTAASPHNDRGDGDGGSGDDDEYASVSGDDDGTASSLGCDASYQLRPSSRAPHEPTEGRLGRGWREGEEGANFGMSLGRGWREGEDRVGKPGWIYEAGARGGHTWPLHDRYIGEARADAAAALRFRTTRPNVTIWLEYMRSYESVGDATAVVAPAGDLHVISM